MRMGGVRVVEQVAGEMRQLRNDLPVGVTLGRDEYGKAWRGEQRHDELPTLLVRSMAGA